MEDVRSVGGLSTVTLSYRAVKMSANVVQN